MKCLSGNLCLKGIEMPEFKLSPYLKGNNSISLDRNLTDEFYGEYSGYSVKQIYIGAPRSVELGVTFKF